MSSFPRRRRSYDEQSLLGISTDNATASIHGNSQNQTRIQRIMRGEGIPVADAHRRQRRRATMTAAKTTLLPSHSNNMKVGIFALPSSLPHHHHRLLRPLTVRTILGFASVLLLLLVVGDIFNDTIHVRTTNDDVKELTETVMRLSQELHDAQLENERNRRRNLESVNNKAISSSKIEANGENRHVANMDENHKIMNEYMLDQIQKDEKNISDNTTASSIATQQQQQQQEEEHYQGHEHQQQTQKQREHSSQSGKEHDKHTQLREALANSIEELDRVRRKQQLQQLQKRTSPIALEEQSSGGVESGGGDEGPGNKSNNTSNSKSYDRLLRGGGIINYLLGDGIETINDYGIGKKEIAFRPGVISDINSDGTFNLFQLESTHPIRNIHREGFRLYQVYTNGTSAFYEQQPKNYVPITIISYVQSSSRPGLEVHGNYLFTFDADENKAPHEGRAMLMYRYADDGEIDS